VSVRGKTTPISELRARVAELERERELLNSVANFAPSLLCLVDQTGRVQPAATNRAFEQTLGYEPSETGGVLFWERYVPEEDAATVRAAIEAVVAGGDPAELEGTWSRRDGSAVLVTWSCTPLPPIAAGTLFLLSATDVTERRRHEEEVLTSRARIVAAADAERKRLERNLHDGAQQRLIALLLSLRVARGRTETPGVESLLDGAIDELAAAVQDLRELARGIHPAALTERGLATAVRLLVARQPLPLEVSLPQRRYDEPIEAAAYYVVAESLANIAKYAQASAGAVRGREEGGRLVVEIEDDGIGGADPLRGTGLRGLADRDAVLDGSFAVTSPVGSGTVVRIELPLPASERQKAPR
jgi:PAS domain S-box-containing protein